MKNAHTKQKKQQPAGVGSEYALNRSMPNPTYMPSAMPRRRGNTGPTSNPTRFEPGQQKSPKKHHNWKKIIGRSFTTVIILVILGIGYVGWKFITNELKVFGWGGLWSLLDPAPLQSQGGRVNILFAGDSVGRTDGGGGQQLTDSIMIASIDTENHTAFLLSVPRDFYGNIPGFGNSKINAAAEDGASNYGNNPNYGSNGIGLLEQVVSQDFGISIDYYALVDYTAFKGAVNAVGGITIDVQSSDPRGLYDASPTSPTDLAPLVDLSNGEHELDGQEALNLARARGDAAGSYGFGASDFERTENQRLMLIAIKTKAATAGVLSNPFKIGELFDSFGDNVETNLSLGNAKKLYDVTTQIRNFNIKSYGLNDANGTNLTTGYYTPDGEDALIPTAGLGDYSQIQAFVSQLTGDSP